MDHSHHHESAARLQEMEDLHQQLVYADGEGGGLGRGGMSSRAAQILQALDACTRSASDLDFLTVSRGLANLLLLLDRDDSMLRTLALPSSLAALVRCAEGGLVQDEAAVSAYVRLLLMLCSGHAGGAAQPDARASQAGHALSVLRSGALAPALSWLFDVRVLTEADDKRALLEAVFLCVEETLTREDAALLLDISRRLIDAILGEYEGYRCEVRGEGAAEGWARLGRASASVRIEVRRARGSTASDAVVIEFACRCTARLVTILSRRAEGHWQLWRPAYEANEDEARAAVRAFARRWEEIESPGVAGATAVANAAAALTDAGPPSASVEDALNMTAATSSAVLFSSPFPADLAGRARSRRHEARNGVAEIDEPEDENEDEAEGKTEHEAEAEANEAAEEAPDAAEDGEDMPAEEAVVQLRRMATRGRQRSVSSRKASRQYNGGPVPSNWPLQALAHLWAMDLPGAWTRALAGHCAYAAPGSQGCAPQGDSSGAAESWAVTIEGAGIGLTNYSVRALVRAQARLLVVVAEHSRLSLMRPTRTLRCVPMPAYGDAVHCLVQNHGLAGIALRLLSLSAGQDLAAPNGSSAVPALATRTLARDAEGLEDCLLLLAALMKAA